MTFEQLQQNALAEWRALEESEVPRIYVGTASCGCSAGAGFILQQISSELKKNKISARIIEVGCLGLCYLEPVIYIAKSKRPAVCYGNVTPEEINRILSDYLVNDNPRGELVFGSIGKGEIEGISDISQLPAFKLQKRVILRNCGIIDPGNINDYIANGGYSGLVKFLAMNPDEIIKEIEKSELRGRGGAGFPTGKKWQTCRNAPGSEKYLICNAAEGDPSAYSERLLLESDPHSILEGMVIAAYATGIKKGFIYVNDKYELAITKLENAIEQMKAFSLIGNDILGTSFGFEIEVRKAAGVFVCGEETALIHSIEGKRGMPHTRPPFPTTSGLFGKPTIVNNVETFACVSTILQKGADWYGKIGTNQSKGTKMFTLSGNVKRTGVFEIPLDNTLRQLIYDIGGGMTEDKELKVIQIGGPGGGCLTESSLDLSIDFESIEKNGAIMGSGSVIVHNSDTCVVDLAKRCISFSRYESCGECVMCREGTMQMLDFITDITEGKGKSDDLDFLIELGEGLQLGSLCGLGKTAPNPIITTINNFRDEYIAHTNRKRCPAKVCKSLITYHILPEKCQGCQECLKVCPSGAIAGAEKMIHLIDQTKCSKCGNCLDICPAETNAVIKASGRAPATPSEPIPVGSWGKN